MMWVIHIIALLTFPVALFVTIPMHIIINIKKEEAAKNEAKSTNHLKKQGYCDV